MGLFYKDEEHKLGKNLKNGASMHMMTNPTDYGIKARTHLLKIASLMMKYRIFLTK